MRIHLTFTGQDNQTHHVTGDWDSAKHAIEWAKEKFKALTGFAKVASCPATPANSTATKGVAARREKP